MGRTTIRLVPAIALLSLAALVPSWPLSAVRAEAPEPPTGADPRQEGPAVEYKPVIPSEVLMEWQGKAMGEVTRGISQKKAKAVAEGAWLLAELSNVNRLRAEKDDYRGWATELRDGAIRLAQAADGNKLDEAREIAQAINANCKACHAVYRP